MDNRTCSIENCERPFFQRGWCAAHWNRVRRTGSPGTAPIQSRRTGCDVPGCEQKHFGRGYCQMHLRRLKTNGDPLRVRKVGQAPGPDHPLWRGDAITYGGAHRRVERHCGKATEYACSACDGPAREWAYIHGSLAEQIDPDTGKPFSADVDDYAPMCAPCHRHYDHGRLEWRGVSA